MIPALLAIYGIGRAAFGVALLIAPAPAGRMLAGDGATAPDAQAFLRGIGARDVGLGLGALGAVRTRRATRGWLVAGVLADTGDAVGIAGAWRNLDPDKRAAGLAFAGTAAAAGVALLAATATT